MQKENLFVYLPDIKYNNVRKGPGWGLITNDPARVCPGRQPCWEWGTKKISRGEDRQQVGVKKNQPWQGNKNFAECDPAASASVVVFFFFAQSL